MIPIITPEVMHEEEAIWDIKDPIERIEVSAKGLFEAIVEILEPNQELVFLCGKGLNGADALSLAKHCYEAGFDIKVHCLFETSCLKKQTLHFYNICQNYQLIQPFSLPEKHKRIVIIDGIFGAGFKGEMPNDIEAIIDACNSLNCLKIAIDIPSGINGENGKGNKALECDLTLSIGFPKWGLFIAQGRYHTGHIKHVNIGLKATIAHKKSLGFLSTQDSFFSYLPKEKAHFHKYERGQVLGLASSINYIGASFLYTKAAYRVGAGLVRLFHEKIANFFTSLTPEVTQHELSELDNFLDKQKTSCVLGPGLIGNDILRATMTKILDKKIPCVIDGGALEMIPHEKLHSQIVLTPHLEELKKLLKSQTDDFDELLKLASNDLLVSGLSLIIKGHHTWILQKDQKPIIFAFAPLATATAGSGDVLAGIIGAYLAKGLSCFESAILSVGVHSLAGKLATFDKSKKAIIAQDIIETLPEALSNL